MKTTKVWLLLVLLLGWAFVSAQNTELPIYARGVYSPSQAVTLNVYHGAKAKVQVNLTILRFQNPLEVLKNGRSWETPKIPAGAAKTPISRVTVSLGEGDSEVSLGKLGVGLYEIQGQFGQKRGSSLVLVTDLSVFAKQSPSQLRVLTVNRDSGQKRSAKVLVFAAQNKRELSTDQNGLLSLAMPSKETIVVAQSGQSFAVVNSAWAYALTQKYVFTGQTDRTMYRPGDTIQFRGNFRADNTLAPITKRQVGVVLCDSERELQRNKFETNAFGSFGGQLTLRASARVSTWDYRILLNPEGEASCNFDGSDHTAILADFSVQQYVKPDFTLALKNPSVALQGTRIPLEVSAAYLFGGGLSNGRVRVSVTRSSAFTTDDPNYTDFGFSNLQDYGAYDSKNILEQTLALDETGKLKLEIPLEVSKLAFPIRYSIQVQAEDESRRMLERYSEVIAYPSSVRVSLRTTRYLYNALEPFEIDLRTRDLAGAAANSSVELQLVRQEYLTSSQIRDGKRQTVYTLKETPLEKRTVQTRNGSARVVFKPTLGGGYVVRARAKDSAGRLSKAETFAWQLADNENWGWAADYAQVRLNKDTYKVGETATALILGLPVGVDVWLALEGRDILQSRLVRTTRSTLAYTFKVTAAMQPNVFLQVSYINQGSPYGGGTTIRVPKDSEKLKVAILSSKPRFAPSETGQLEVQVTNSAEQPVQTELSLAVVDEGVYLLREDGTSNPFDVLQGDRPSLVSTTSSEDQDGEFGGGGGGEEDYNSSAARDINDQRVRKDFRDTALWLGTVLTDTNGIAKVPVSYPDNLTTWRVTARGQTLAGAAGEQKIQTLVTKDVITRVAKPEFLVRGDTTNLRGLVNNNLAQNSSGVFKFDLLGLTGTSLEGRLEVPANARANFNSQVSANQIGQATIRASYTSSQGSDALELPLTVLPRGFVERQALAGDATQAKKTLTLPEDALLETARLHVTLTPSLLSAVQPALERLIAYPYGCTEQTLSRFVPAILASEIAPRDDLNDLLDVGLRRLETLRHTDGGWGFWTYDESAMDMTASVVLALARLQQQKIPKDRYASMLETGIKWLRDNLKNTSFSRGSRALAHRALALAGAPDLDTMQLFAAIPDLEPYHLAQLALAYQSLGRLDLARNLLERLKATRVERDSTVQWQRPKTPYEWYYYWDDNPILVTATALEALGKLEPQSPLIPKAVNYLLQARRGDWWVSTADTSAIISAALTLPQPVSSNQTVRLVLNGKTISEQNVGAQGINLDLEPSMVKGENTLEIIGNLAYGVRLEYTREPTRLVAESNGIRINRTYSKLEKRWNEQASAWEYTSRPLIQNGVAQPVEVGELILVTLEISPQSGSMRHLQVIEPVPAGFQAVNAYDLNLDGVAAATAFGVTPNWQEWYAARDFYNNRVEMFAQGLDGTNRFRVVLRAQTAGTYTHLPSTAELMYDPEVRGRSSAATLTVRE